MVDVVALTKKYFEVWNAHDVEGIKGCHASTSTLTDWWVAPPVSVCMLDHPPFSRAGILNESALFAQGRLARSDECRRVQRDCWDLGKCAPNCY